MDEWAGGFMGEWLWWVGVGANATSGAMDGWNYNKLKSHEMNLIWAYGMQL